jgi:GDP-4-dehydro-6-deoxy-D-mannose reductase
MFSLRLIILLRGCFGKSVIIEFMSKILVTGVNGFVGHHVANQLHEAGYQVVGVGNQPELQEDLNGVVGTYISCDLTDPERVIDIDLSDVAAIINLAGFASVGDSEGKSELYDKVNIGVHAVLYDECLRQNVNPRIVAVSTGAVYDSNQELPITEDSSIIPRDKANVYVISKQKMEEAVAGYASKGLRVIIARPFNHSGPGQLPGFLLPDLGIQIEDALRTNKPLLVGNLETKRDYTDVRDVAKAYIALATTDENSLKHDVYNICSGKSLAGKEILQTLAEAFGAEHVEIQVDQSRIRPNDVMDIYGSRDRLTQDTGWEPTISVKQMVHDYAEWKKSH